MPAEAHPDNNFNKTIYRNQINKVANSIKEILSGLSGDYNTGTNEKIVRHEKLQGNTVKKILIGLLIFLIIGTGVSLIFLKISKPHLFTKDLIALNFYESGKEYFDKYIRTKNRVTLITAASSFRKALSRDPAFAEAYVGLAAVAYRNSNADDISKSDYLDSVMILCNQAISINSHISDAYVYLGFYYRDLNQIQKSEAQFNTALKQDPENFLAFIGLGILYQEIDPVKSVINLQKAISLDDGSYRLDLLRALAHEYRITGFNDKAKVIYNEIYKLDHEYGLLNYRLAVNEYSIGNYSESLNYALKAYVEDSTNTDFISWIGYSYFLIRDFKNSMKYNNMLIPKLNPESLLWNLHRIAYCYYQTGLKEKGDSCLNRMFESLKNLKDLDRYTGDINRTYYDLACAYAVRGDKEKEIQNLKLYFTQSFINLDYLTSLKKDPLLDNIRDDDEYKRLVTEMDQKFRIQHEQIRKWLENNNFL